MRPLLLLLAFLSCSVQAMTVVEVKPDGSRTEYTVGDSFAFQLFKYSTNPVSIISGGQVTSITVQSFMTKAGDLLTVGENGAVYRNGMQMSTINSSGVSRTFADKMVSIGPEIYIKNKADAKWYRWTAHSNSWVMLTGAYDKTILD